MGDLVERLRRVWSALTPGAIERADLDGMAFTVREAADEITALRERVAALEAELSGYRQAEEARQRQGEQEWAYTQRRLREEAEKREAGRWSSQ